jgi:hypothetical protein
MILFFYVVSIAFHTSVQHFGSACIPLEKKFFWLRAQPLVHRLLHLFVGPERLASHRLFGQSKDMKVTGGRGLASTVDVEDARRIDLGLLQQLNGQYGSRALSCWSKTPILLVCILLMQEDILMAMRSTLLFLDDGVLVHFLWYLKQFLDSYYLCQFMGQNGSVL